jgi:hypothetical protein
MFREFGFLAQDLGPGYVIIVIVERQLAAQERVENDTQTPNINLFACVFFTLQHLWC